MAAWAAWLPAPPPLFVVLGVTPGAARALRGGAGQPPKAGTPAAAAWEEEAWRRVCAHVKGGGEPRRSGRRGATPAARAAGGKGGTRG